MKGILYGIGTGTGDPTDLTFKAIETVKKCSVVFLPTKSRENCHAYNTVKKIFPEIDGKELVFCDFPMTKDEEILHRSWNETASKVCAVLDKGTDAAFLTIGDPTVYSTYFYIDEIISGRGYKTRIVNGITSFCAVAARLGITLSEQDEEIHIIPASYEVSDAMELEGTLVFMKSGRKLMELKKLLARKKEISEIEVKAVSNCGMENEKIFRSLEEIDPDSGYLTVVIVKKNKGGKNPDEKNYAFFQNRKCEKFPCHKTERIEDFNCLFCYCPLYALGKHCGGNFMMKENGVKSCVECSFPHERKNYEKVNSRFNEINELIRNRD